jgi:hypothetical protein
MSKRFFSSFLLMPVLSVGIAVAGASALQTIGMVVEGIGNVILRQAAVIPAYLVNVAEQNLKSIKYDACTVSLKIPV